jgi:CubicO group peptidase (beta-lactamase class C family)
VPGAAAAVVDDRHTVWEMAWGTVDGDGSAPVDVHTGFSIQSMSKSFTALAVLMAVQDGLVDLDTPVAEYLPDFTVNSIYEEHPEHRITLRHLLTHRAGFTHEAPFGSNFDDRNDFTKHIASIADTWLRYPVGHRWSYANPGYDLAGYILQILSGQPFEAYVKQHVLDPIGMSESSLNMDVIETWSNRGLGHRRDGVRPPLRIPMIPAGGVYTSVRDMAKYLRFHINKGIVDGRRILRADLVEEMHTIQYAWRDQRSGYALGLLRDPVADSYGLYHGGGGYGFQSEMVMYPEKELGVVLLTNLSGNDVDGSRVRSFVQQSLYERHGTTPVADPDTASMTRLEPGDPRIHAVLGRYGAERGLLIEERDGVVGLGQAGNPGFYPLTFFDDARGLVGLYGRFSEIRFLPPIAGRRPALTDVTRRLSNAYFHTYDFNDAPNDPAGPNASHWVEYVGDYVVLQYGVPDDTVSVSIRNGYLYFGEARCSEHDRGLFFTFAGQALDLRTNAPSYANIPLRKIGGTEETAGRR